MLSFVGLPLCNIQGVSKKLAWSVFYTNSELDCIFIIRELLCVKFGLVNLPLFDIARIDCMLNLLCTE